MIDWVVLTRGDRPDELAASVASLRSSRSTSAIIVVANGAPSDVVIELDDALDAKVLRSAVNLGVPGGRDLGLRQTDSPLVGFLDDDARLVDGDPLCETVERFDHDQTLGAVSLRLVDEAGATARRHIPRRGSRDVAVSGPVSTFLGGASIIRRSAYDAAGGYWDVLVYGHEELELAWRLIDVGYSIRYDAEVQVFHPRTEISRHADGWWRTGRNRVLIARRNLPFAVRLVHVFAWLLIGIRRAPNRACRQRYVAGWFGAWRIPVERRVLEWSTLRELHRVGRFPIV